MVILPNSIVPSYSLSRLVRYCETRVALPISMISKPSPSDRGAGMADALHRELAAQSRHDVVRREAGGLSRSNTPSISLAVRAWETDLFPCHRAESKRSVIVTGRNVRSKAGVERRMGSITQGSTSTARNKPGPLDSPPGSAGASGYPKTAKIWRRRVVAAQFPTTLTAQRPPSQSATDFSDSLSLSERSLRRRSRLL